MKKYFFFLLSLFSNSLFSQSNVEIAGIKYRTTTKSNYAIYKSNNNTFDAFINYGHDLGQNTKLFYHLSYHSFDLHTEINSDNNNLANRFYYPSIPDFSFVNIASGMTNTLKNKWYLTNIVSFTFSDDFNESKLKLHSYFRSFSYVKKKKSPNFTYGFGIYLSKLNTDWRILPILNLQVQNDKRGMKLFLPRELKFWNRINQKSYLELKTILNSNYLKFTTSLLDSDLLSINSELTYNYIFKKKLKLKTGIGLPYTQYKYISNLDTYQINQFNISFIIGLSYIIFKKD